MSMRTTPVPAETLNDGGETSQASKVLAVGDIQSWVRMNRSVTEGPVRFAGFHEVTAEALNHLSPALVVSPLFSRRFDCLDLAVTLHEIGYRGAYRVYAGDLPDPGIVVEEVRSITPGLDFDILPDEEFDL